MSHENLDDIPPTSRLFWMGYYFRVALTYEDRYELECLDGFENGRTLPRKKVVALKHTGDLVVEPYYFDLDGNPAKPGRGMDILATRTPQQRRRAMCRLTLIKMFHKDRKAGKVALSETRHVPRSNRRRRHATTMTVNEWLALNASAVNAECKRFYVIDPKAPKFNEKPRLGQTPPPVLGSASALKKDYAKFRKKGFKVVNLCPDTEGQRQGGRKMEQDMANFLEKFARTFLLRRQRPSIEVFRRQAKAHLRTIPDMANRNVPHTKAIQRLLGGLDDGKVYAALFGEKAALEAKTIYTEGHRFNYPGEMVSMDCYMLDLVVRLDERGGWMFATAKELEEEWGFVRRIWVSFAVDMCSRAILGIALGLSESVDLTTGALRMVVTDKSRQCIDAGCTGKPLPAIGLNGLGTDIGDAFKNERFQFSALSLTEDVDIGPGDNPHLHGIQERVNRTIKEQLLTFFEGYTFGNVIAKGDYKAVERASADVKTIGRALWGWCNDVYNRSPHRGLNNQAPYDRFHETMAAEGAADASSEEDLRLAFGLQFDVQVTREGVRFAGNRYVSGRLQSYFKNGPKKGRPYGETGKPLKVRILVDPCDLGRVSAYLDGEWCTLAGPTRMRGIGLSEWLLVTKELALKHRAQSSVHASVVTAMLLKLERGSAETRLQAGLEDMSYDSDAVAKAANKIRIRIKEDETPTDPGKLLALDHEEASFPATGAGYPDGGIDEVEDFPLIEAVEDPYGNDGPIQRAETDLGLDQADIDQDGEPQVDKVVPVLHPPRIEEGGIDPVEVYEVAPVDPKPAHKNRGRPPVAPTRPAGFLAKPTQRNLK